MSRRLAFWATGWAFLMPTFCLSTSSSSESMTPNRHIRGFPDERPTSHGTSDPVSTTEASGPQRVGFWVTGHGYGHATRVVEVCKELLRRRYEVVVCTCAPPEIFTRDLPDVQIRSISPLDVGGVQLDALSVDVEATLAKYHDLVHLRRRELIEAEGSWMKQAGLDLVLSDSPPIVCAAARWANKPSACITNLVWSTVYKDYPLHCMPAHADRYRAMIEQIRADYSTATAVLRLPGASSMQEFQRIIDVPLVVRRAKTTPADVRRIYGIAEDEKVVLVTFGGQATEWSLDEKSLPPGWRALVTGVSDPEDLPPGFIAVKKHTYVPDLVNAADVVLSKLGYGIWSECLFHKKPLVYVPRTHWNEQDDLLKVMDAAIRMRKEEFFAGHWGPYLEAAHRMKDVAERFTCHENGASVVCDRLEEIMRADKKELKSPAREEGSADPIGELERL